MPDIWAQCRHQLNLQTIHNELIRVVESQEQIATNSLVDNLEEQAALEQMLEEAKPVLPATASDLDYLLATPFRYPPLDYGSRFGTRYEPSVFYGSLSLTTAFAETGYYRYLFWSGMSEPPPSGKLVTQHTVFGVGYQTDNGLKLQDMPFNQYESHLIDPFHYEATQMLGAAMRDYGIVAFEYLSARDTARGLNVALLEPSALAATTPLWKAPWLCEITASAVSFYSSTTSENIHKYPYDSYLVDGEFPHPAI